MRKIKHRPIAFRLWLSAIDPGLIRLRSAGRGALALLSTWLVLRTAVQLWIGDGGPPIPLVGLLSGFILLLLINDLKPAERKVSLGLGTLLFAAGILLAGLLRDYFWLYNPLLLLLFFLSYFTRRYGTRAGELALATTIGYYLGFLIKPVPAVYPILLACIFISALIIYLWQFVLIPYDPPGYLLGSVRTFYHNVARGVAAVRSALETGQGEALDPKTLQRHLKAVHINRRLIEGLFAAIVSPAVWSQSRLNQLQEEMFKTERGLELLIEAGGKLSEQIDELPEDVLATLKEGLVVLEEHLWEVASGEGQTRLSEIGEWLLAQVKSSLEEKPGGEWIYSLQRLALASRQLARSVAEIQAIKTAWQESPGDAPPTKKPSAAKPAPVNPLGKKMGFTLHPTSILGLQAVLATGLAILAATLLKMDQPNLVFWTAFVVIAGSTGESLRRITLRVAGVIAGTVIGVALAVILPDHLTLVVLLVTICFFLTIYTITISYFWMVFWLNIAILLIITTLGGAALELLTVRTASTLLGAAIAGLVVTFILPIRVQNRYLAALSEFLRAVDQTITTYVAHREGTSEAGDLVAEELKIDLSYKKLELALPGVSYEYNPLTRSQNRFTGQSTSLAVLKGYVARLKEDVDAEGGGLSDARQVELLRKAQEQIHANVEALIHSLAGGMGVQKPADLPRQTRPLIPPEEIGSLESGSLAAMRNPALVHLARINDTILQIAASLGAPAD